MNKPTPDNIRLLVESEISRIAREVEERKARGEVIDRAAVAAILFSPKR